MDTNNLSWTEMILKCMLICNTHTRRRKKNIILISAANWNPQMARGVPGLNHIHFFLPKCSSESVYVYIKVVNKGGYDTSGVYEITSSRELPVQTFFSWVVVPCCVFLPPLWLSLSPGLSTTTAKYTHSTNIYNPLRSIQKKKRIFIELEQNEDYGLQSEAIIAQYQ